MPTFGNTPERSRNMLKPEAVKLLRKVKRHVIQEPNRLVMDDVIVRKQGEEDKSFFGDGGKNVKFAECGTAGCIAAWMVLLHDGMKTQRENILLRAQRLLGIPGTSPDVPLFYVGCWDSFKPGLVEKYEKAKTQKQRAKLVGDAIDAFIEHNRKEHKTQKEKR